MGSTLTNLVAHIIFGTKNRFPVIAETIEPRLYEYMGGIICGEGSILLAIGGMPDHIHVLAKIRSDHSMAEMVKRSRALSGRSSYE